MKKSEILKKAITTALRTYEGELDRLQFLCVAVYFVVTDAGDFDRRDEIRSDILAILDGELCVEIFLRKLHKNKPTFRQCYDFRVTMANTLIRKYEAQGN